MSNLNTNGDRLAIGDVDLASIERELAAVGVRVIETSRARGGTRRWFLCPARDCQRRCAILFIVDDRLVCRWCRQKLARRPFTPDPRPPKNRPIRRRGAEQLRGAQRFLGRTCTAPAVRSAPPPAVRLGKPRRELVENCRRITVGRLLKRFGPAALDDRHGNYTCPITARFSAVLRASTPHFGGVRWWLVCPACGGACAVLYWPRSVRRPDLRCRKCWGLAYASQSA